MEPTGPAIAFEGVTKRFGDVVALDAFSLKLGPGEFLGLLGRNGAGKTTAIQLATGLLRPDSGRIRVLGDDVVDRPLQVKRRIGVMSQTDSALDCLTGDQYLDFVGRIYGLEPSRIDQRRRELYEALELAPGPRKLVREYSYGMKKKLGLSAALIHGPRIVFLDEPFEGIDPLTSRTIKEILLSLQARGVTILMSSHVLEVVERLCPRIAILDKGSLLGDGTVAELRESHGGGDLETLFVSLMGGARSGELSWL